MYQVLARKYRPRNFHELVGQSHVSRALSSALERGRLHHAYLFTGTRGVGKTTIARILAKCLNCETGITATPCEVCATCRAVNEGRFIDLIEIDAASRTKVEDTRELLDNVPYAPTQGRFKVYLIDEVHMLSTHSFNALLKTLEEPPEHVKFLFATTDPQKLPITVISRCLQFTLRLLAIDEIQQHLTALLSKEQISAHHDAVWQIAEAAQGSLRDALSLTDQAIAYGQGQIQAQDVKDMLGLLDRNMIYDLLLSIHHNAQQQVSQLLLQMRQQALDVSMVLDQLIATLHELAMLQHLPDLALTHSLEIQQKLKQLSGQIHAQDLQLYYQIACKGRADLALAVTQQQGFEMCILRMLAFKPLAVDQSFEPPQQHAQQQQPHQQQSTTPTINAQPQPTSESQPQQLLKATAEPTSESTDFVATVPTMVQSQSKAYQVAEIETQKHFEAVQPQTIIEITAADVALDQLSSENLDTTVVDADIETAALHVDDNLDHESVHNPPITNATVIKPIANTDAIEIDALPFELPTNTSFQAISETAQTDWLAFPPEQAHASQTTTQTMTQTTTQMEMAASPPEDSDLTANRVLQTENDTLVDDQTIDLFGSTNTQNEHGVLPNQSAKDATPLQTSGLSDDVSIPTHHQNSLSKTEFDIASNLAHHQSVNLEPSQQSPQQLLRVPEQSLTGQWDVYKWDYWLRSANISPALQELAQHAVMSGEITGESTLTIAAEYENMLSQLHNLLHAALQQQWPEQRLNIVYQDPESVTPYALQQQRKQAAFDRAEMLLKQHPTIMAFVQNFGASVENIQLKS